MCGLPVLSSAAGALELGSIMHLTYARDARLCAVNKPREKSMSKPILFVTAYFVDSVETRLNQDFALRRKKSGDRFTPEELISAADGADAMLVTPADRLDAAFFRRVAPSVKIIATHSVGYDHIDLKAAAAQKIAVAYIPGISTDAVADITLLRLLAHRGERMRPYK
jgi:lactate dehydrogenase-like 2-hydroxyacid dehydrogenase